MLRGIVLPSLGVAHCVSLDGGAGELSDPGQGELLGQMGPDGGDITTKVLSDLSDVQLLGKWEAAAHLFNNVLDILNCGQPC